MLGLYGERLCPLLLLERGECVKCLILLLAVSLGWGASPVPLPTMSLPGLQGQFVATSTWGVPGQWLLVYIRPNCRACDSALRLINANAASKVVIVGAMPVTELKKVAANYTALSGATWYSDSSNQLAALLNFTGSPVTFGVRNRSIFWNINGVLQDQDQNRTILEGWVR
jgi:hypothetical protein